MNKLAFAAGIALCAFSLPALAHEERMMQQMVDQKMQMMDTDHDGYISREEWDNAMDRKFDEADTDGDGYLSRAELLAAKKREHAMMMDRMRMMGNDESDNRQNNDAVRY